jgi:hypothetical protein
VLQRLIAALLGVLGIAAIGLGIASATAWRADDPLVATAAPGGDSRTLVTDPGVLELAGDPVTVTVRAEGSPVVLAVGRDTDVTGWVGTDPYVRVTGLSDWHTLATTAVEPPATEPSEPSETAAATPAPTPSESAAAAETPVQAADPAGSDMWLAEVSGDGSATLEWPVTEGRWSLVAVSLGDTAPTLDLSWPQTVTTPWLWPGVAVGVLLLAIAAVLLVRILRERREGPDAGWHSVATGQIAVVPAAGSSATVGATEPGSGATGMVTGPVPTVAPDGTPLTRRQIREAEAAAAAAAAARRRGRRTATGSIPVVTGAIPTVTGSVPVVTPAAGAGAGEAPGAPAGPGVPAGPVTAGPRVTAAPAGPGAPTAQVPVSGPATPAPGAPASSTSAKAVTSAAADPARSGAAEPTAAPADDTGAARGLAARLPWRRGRAEGGTTTEPTAPSSAPSWAPVPGATTSPVPPRPVTAPGASGSGASGTATPGAAAPGAAAPRPGGTSPGAGAPARPAAPTASADPEDDAASRAQRADAWRRMWGFPADAAGGSGEGGTDPRTGQGTARPQDDAQRTEEGR